MRTSTRSGVVEPEVIGIAREQLAAAQTQAVAAVQQVSLVRRHLDLTRENLKSAFVFGWISAVTAIVVAAATVAGLWLAVHRATSGERAIDSPRVQGATLGVPQNQEDLSLLAARVDENERHIAAVKDDLSQIQARAASPVAAPPSHSPVSRAAVAVIPPQQLVRVEPRYPDVARHRRMYGNVNVTYVVEIDGTVSIRSWSGNALLVSAALAAVSQWTFIPASQGSKRVRYTQTVSLMFRPPQP